MIEQEQILRLLAEKKQLMLEFEKATEEMLSCPFELLQPMVRQREEKMRQMQAIEAKINGFCTGREGVLALVAVENSCDRAALPVQLQQIYDAGMQVKTIASRLKESDTQATFRLRNEQKQILKKIKATNQSPAAQAARFSLPVRQRGPGRLGKA